MTSEVKLVGMGRSADRAFTLESLGLVDNMFHARSGLSTDRFNALWDYCKGNWVDAKTAIIEHDGFTAGGLPKNAVVIEVRD